MAAGADNGRVLFKYIVSGWINTDPFFFQIIDGREALRTPEVVASEQAAVERAGQGKHLVLSEYPPRLARVKAG